MMAPAGAEDSYGLTVELFRPQRKIIPRFQFGSQKLGGLEIFGYIRSTIET